MSTNTIAVLLSTTTMSTNILVTALLVALCLHSGWAVDTPQVTLEGTASNEDYMKVHNDMQQQYVLTCQYRAGYDDIVTSVTWLLYGQEVYTWTPERDTVTVSSPLLGRVDGSPSDPGSNIRVLQPHLSLAGTYNCLVTSTKGEATSNALHVHVIDVDSEEYETHVEVLSKYSLESNDTDTYTDTTTTASADNWHPTPPPTPDASCVLVWGFKTPAIAPRPNVTCGFYSYTADDISQVVPGGVQLHQLPGGRWQAEIQDTRIPVSEIPQQGRLGCSVTIPHTSYRKMVKFEDGLTVDHLIDSVGCPSLHHFEDLYGFQLSVEGATTSCRGDHLPTSTIDSAMATVSCPSYSKFHDGHVYHDWRLVLHCSSQDLVWRRIDGDKGAEDHAVRMGSDSVTSDDPMMGEPVHRIMGQPFDELAYQWPICVGGGSANSYSRTIPGAKLIVMLLMALRSWILL